MERTTLYIFLIFIIGGCSLLPSEKKIFELETDLIEFSDKMNEGDTLHIFSNLSVCRSFHFEHDIFTKEGNQIYIKTSAKGYLIEDWEVELPKTKYSKTESDSLNYEELLKYVSRNETKNKSINTRFLRVIYKKDTICFYSEGLGEQVPNSDYLRRIKRRINPEAKIYEPMEAIEPPPPPPFPEE